MKSRNSLAMVCAMAVIFTAGVAIASTYYWDTDGTTDGFGNVVGTWGTSAFWSTNDTGASATANTTITTGDGINFGTASLALGSTASAVGVSGTVTVNSITFGAAQATAVTLSGGTSITLGGTTPSITVNNASNTISSVVAGSSFTKAGSGTLTLSGNNTHTGTTTISAGTLRLLGANMWKTARTYTINSGAVLNLDGGVNFGTGTAATTIINGSGTLRLSNGSYSMNTSPGAAITMSLGAGSMIDVQSGALLQNGGWQNITWTANLASLNVDGTFDIWDGNTVTAGALTGSGSITKGYTGNQTLNVGNGDGSGTFSGVIQNPTGAIALTKTGGGTQTLSGNNRYTGSTTVSVGTLLVNGSINSAVSVASGAYLGGTGAITGAVTFASGARATFTNSAPLRFAGTVTLNNNTVYLTLSDNLAAGTYLLATNTTGSFSGTFAATPVITNGSSVGACTITNDTRAVRLIVSPPPNLSVSVTTPVNGRIFLPGSSVTATVSVVNGTMPYAVTFYTNSAVAWSTNSASTNLFNINLGALANGTYTHYATVTDSVSSNATSSTNSFTVAPDTTAPTPNPMTFAVNPRPLDVSRVVMTAATATDALSPPVEYFFTNTVNGSNSGWISGTVWTNSGLTKGVSYGYRVKARDASPAQNETAFSDVFNAVPTEPTILWDANATGANQTDGGGTWLAANQWWDGSTNVTWNNSSLNNAVIGNGGAGGTITVDAVTAGNVLLNNFTGTYTFDGTAGASTLTQSAGITNGATAGNVTFRNTVIAGSGGIIKDSPGLLILGSNPATTHTYTGPTVINNGVVMISGAKKSTGNFTLNNGMLTDYYQAGTAFTGGLGAGNNQIQIYGNSGFGGGNGNSTWTIGTTGSTLQWGSTYFNPMSLKFLTSADNMGPSIYGAVTLDNGLDLKGGDRTIYVLAATPNASGSTASSWAKITGVITNSSGTAAGLVKTGGGMLILSAANKYNGTTTVSNGVLQLANANALPGGINATGGTSALTLDGGVVELASANFLRDLGTGSAQFQITGGTSGFSANGAVRYVNVNNTVSQELQWGSATFNPTTLVLNAATANNVLNLQNKLDLNGATRSIAVNANTATISNDVRTTSGSAVGLTKSGAGTLLLAGNNSYDGTNTISGGLISVGASANLGTAGAGVSFDGGGIQITGTTLNNFSGRTVSFTSGKSVSFDISTAANTFTVDQVINLGSGGLTKLGAGTLVLSGNNTYSGSANLSGGKLVAVGPSAIGSGTITWKTSGTTLSFQQDSGFSVTNAWDLSSQNLTRTIMVDRVTPGAANAWIITKQMTTIDTGCTMNWQAGPNITSGTPTVTVITAINCSDSSDGTVKLAPAGVVLRINGFTNTRWRYWELAGTSTNNEVYGAVNDNGSYVCGITKTGTGTWALSAVNNYTRPTTINAGTLFGVTGGSCAKSSVTVTNTTGSTAALGISVTNSTLQWSCTNLILNTTDGGAQLKFAFGVTPSQSQAPLKILNALTFNGTPTVVVESANVGSGKTYPLLVSDVSAPSALPALSGVRGSLSWGGTGNRTLYLNTSPNGTLIRIF